MKINGLLIISFFSITLASAQNLPSDNFRLYNDSIQGFQFEVPKDWFVKTDARPEKQDTLHIERLHIENFDGKSIRNFNTDMTDEKSVIVLDIFDTKVLYVKGIIDPLTRIETIEDWIKTGFDPYLDYLVEDKTGIEKRLSNVSTGKIGGKEIMIWQNKTPTYRGADFVYKKRFYRIIMQSGSEDQMQKDVHVYEKILETLQIQ